jgi:hypothetical protein
MNTDTPRTKRNADLPEDVGVHLRHLSRADRNAYLQALRAGGWTLRSLAQSSGLTRERVRQLLELPLEPTDREAIADLPVPELPVRPDQSRPQKADVSPETLARLRELQPTAQLVRSHGKRHRLEAEEYTELLAHAVLVEGVSVYRLAKHLGVTHNAIRFRLMRYGYVAQPDGRAHRVHQPLAARNRA